MKLTLPYPVSANRYWRHYRGERGEVRVKLSSEAQAYKAEVGWLAKAAGLRAPIPGLLDLRVVLHPVQPKTITVADRRCMDLDNALKVVIDALQDIAYGDDKLIRRIVAERGAPIPNGGLTVEILRYEERKAA